MQPWIGKTMTGIGIIHTVAGLLLFKNILAGLLQAGLFNTVNGEWDRQTAFWFLFSGFFMVLLGAVVHREERLQHALPAFFNWGFLAVVMLGAFIMPVSGWWALLVPAIGLVWKGRQSLPV